MEAPPVEGKANSSINTPGKSDPTCDEGWGLYIVRLGIQDNGIGGEKK